MDNAQKKALEVYPEPVQANYQDSFDGYEQFLQDSLTNSLSRACFAEGYRQSEKDLALTWEDMSTIDEIIHDVRFDFRDKTCTRQEYYEEVLRRFNEQKNK